MKRAANQEKRMKIKVIKKAEVKNAANGAQCPWVVEDMLPSKR
jgi:hypothetical protein